MIKILLWINTNLDLLRMLIIENLLKAIFLTATSRINKNIAPKKQLDLRVSQIIFIIILNQKIVGQIKIYLLLTVFVIMWKKTLNKIYTIIQIATKLWFNLLLFISWMQNKHQFLQILLQLNQKHNRIFFKSQHF